MVYFTNFQKKDELIWQHHERTIVTYSTLFNWFVLIYEVENSTSDNNDQPGKPIISSQQ